MYDGSLFPESFRKKVCSFFEYSDATVDYN